MKFALRWMLPVLISVCFFNVQSHARCFPPNDFYKYDNVNAPSNVTEQQFNQIIDAVVSIWTPIAALHGATLTANKLWNNSTVNASASQSGTKWTINMYGGLARRQEVTPDGFALVVCHELGHHFGGYYHYSNNNWASSEGQSDYFATDVCAKRVFSLYRGINPRFRQFAPGSVKERCDKVWTTQAAQDLCYRSAAGGQSLANLLAVLGGSPMPNVQTPDPTKVTRTNVEHPNAQCRLDTYLNGALCTVTFDPKLIPGKGLPTGNNSKEAEVAASKYSCTVAGGQTEGLRPDCWFKSQLLSNNL